MPSALRPPPIAHVPTHQIRNHARTQAQQLFAHCFRVLTHTQLLNQHIWEERQELQQSLRRQRPRSWLAQKWSITDDEKLLALMDAQIRRNTETIAWCQQKLTENLTLSGDARRQLDGLLSSSRETKFAKFVKKSLKTLWNIGGLAALMYVADYYYPGRGSKGWNALMRLLGRHDLKLQQMFGMRSIDWLKSKLGLQPYTLMEKFWAGMMQIVKQRDPSKSFFLRRLASGTRWLASPVTGLASRLGRVLRGGEDAEDTPPMLADWAHPAGPAAAAPPLQAFRCAAVPPPHAPRAQ